MVGRGPSAGGMHSLVCSCSVFINVLMSSPTKLCYGVNGRGNLRIIVLYFGFQVVLERSNECVFSILVLKLFVNLRLFELLL